MKLMQRELLEPMGSNSLGFVVAMEDAMVDSILEAAIPVVAWKAAPVVLILVEEGFLVLLFQVVVPLQVQFVVLEPH